MNFYVMVLFFFFVGHSVTAELTSAELMKTVCSVCNCVHTESCYCFDVYSSTESVSEKILRLNDAHPCSAPMSRADSESSMLTCKESKSDSCDTIPLNNSDQNSPTKTYQTFPPFPGAPLFEEDESQVDTFSIKKWLKSCFNCFPRREQQPLVSREK